MKKADELLQKYCGPYIVESFNIFAVAWYKTHRPEIIRGQLSEAFTANPNYRTAGGFACQYLLFNCYTKPDFIAYDAKHWKNISRNLTRTVYRCPAVAWTIQSEEELAAMKNRYDLFLSLRGFFPECRRENSLFFLRETRFTESIFFTSPGGKSAVLGNKTEAQYAEFMRSETHDRQG